MIIRINKSIVDLFTLHGFHVEVALEWILGYIHEDLSRNIPTFSHIKYEGETLDIHISKVIIDQIHTKFTVNDDNRLSLIINHLCLTALLLGGTE